MFEDTCNQYLKACFSERQNHIMIKSKDFADQTT